MLPVIAEEQELLRSSVRTFAERRQAELQTRALRGDDMTWTAFAEQGWLGAALPEAAGGLGGRVIDWAIIAEELGRTLTPEPFACAAAAAKLLADLAPNGALLADVLNGRRRVVIAHVEAEARGDARWVETEATQHSGACVLSGRKGAVLGGPSANLSLVTARLQREDGVGVFAVERSAAGSEWIDYRTIDNRGASNLVLRSAAAQAVSGTGEDALDEIERAHDFVLTLSAAEALGAMERAFEMTRSHLKTRRQFGQPIGDFQALRHRLADMYIELEQARSIVLRAVAALEDDRPGERQRTASAAKARVAQAGRFITSNAIQLHGAIGVTEEFAVGHYFKRLTVFTLLNGPDAAHVERFLRHPVEEN